MFVLVWILIMHFNNIQWKMTMKLPTKWISVFKWISFKFWNIRFFTVDSYYKIHWTKFEWKFICKWSRNTHETQHSCLQHSVDSDDKYLNQNSIQTKCQSLHLHRMTKISFLIEITTILKASLTLINKMLNLFLAVVKAAKITVIHECQMLNVVRMYYNNYNKNNNNYNVDATQFVSGKFHQNISWERWKDVIFILKFVSKNLLIWCGRPSTIEFLWIDMPNNAELRC